jgi:hypothetical protein
LLPFANISDDPQQQYFTGGLTDDLTTDLSRFADMFVIARNTAFTYRDKPVDAKQIGRELGVRCVLEGNGQWSGNQVRINAQLLIAKLPPVSAIRLLCPEQLFLVCFSSKQRDQDDEMNFARLPFPSPTRNGDDAEVP